jgi:hypothetical protein
VDQSSSVPIAVMGVQNGQEGVRFEEFRRGHVLTSNNPSRRLIHLVWLLSAAQSCSCSSSNLTTRERTPHAGKNSFEDEDDDEDDGGR